MVDYLSHQWIIGGEWLSLFKHYKRNIYPSEQIRFFKTREHVNYVFKQIHMYSKKFSGLYKFKHSQNMD